jgi:hypothetical protein
MANALSISGPTAQRAPRISNGYTTTERDERVHRRRSTRLSDFEAEDLRYLWSGWSVDMGVRSPHGALEARLLLAPPRDVAAPILEELERLGNWVCEGRLLRLLALDRVVAGVRVTARGVPGELRRGLRLLVRAEKVERRALVMPDVSEPKDRTTAQQQQLDDWTGFEVRGKTQPGRRIVALEREERWRRQDEELERGWRVCYGSESHHTAPSYDPPENVQMSRVNRARRALAKVSARDARVLAIVFGQHHVTDTDELDAVRALVGGDEEAARTAIDAACVAYREARAR